MNTDPTITIDESASIKRLWREGSPAFRDRLRAAFPVECDEVASEIEALDKIADAALDEAIRTVLKGDPETYGTGLRYDALKAIHNVIDPGVPFVRPATSRLDDVAYFLGDKALSFRQEVRVVYQRLLLARALPLRSAL